MRSFRYDGGVLVDCNWEYDYVRRPLPWPPIDIYDIQRTKRERRQEARSGDRGRRMFQRRVPRFRPPPKFRDLVMQTVDYHRHILAREFRPNPFAPRVRQEAALYLPAGESVTATHLADVTRALGGR